jgi:hypothetical protein
MSKCIVWVIFVSLVLCLAPLGAQTTTGEIVGTVTDTGGATVAGGTITDTIIAVKATTNACGTNLGLRSLELEDRHV